MPDHAVTDLDADLIGIEFLDGDRWDQMASQFADALHEQTNCFNTARWGDGNVENVVFTQSGTVIGGASVILLTPPVLKTGIAIVKWGPLWRRHGETPDPGRLCAILSILRKEYAERRGHYLTVMPPADPEHTHCFVDGLERLGFIKGDALPSPERYLVDVTLNQNDLRASFSQKCRHNLKKALKQDFEFTVTDDGQGVEMFLDLYETMLKRKNFNDTSAIRTLRSLMDSNVPTFRPRLILMSYQGTPTAGAVIDMSGDKAIYLYGATDARALPLNAGYALHWYIASFLCESNRILQYDLGGNDLDRGLHQFKKGFVGKHGVICSTPPSYHYGATAKARALGKAVFKLREIRQNVQRMLDRK
jgi:hypothetical protein